MGLIHLYQPGSNRYIQGRFVGGDVIRMELNVAKAILKFYKNGKDINFQVADIDTSKIYRLAISLFSAGSKVTIIDSEFICI